jgi:hypothetical protein
MKPGENNEQPRKIFSSGFWILLAAIVATAVKLLLAWNTIGTNDTIVFFRCARELTLQGLAETYRQAILFTHPPLVAYYLRAIYELSNSAFFVQNNISFAFLLRLPGIVADFVSSLVILKLAETLPGRRIPFWALLLFALNPISLMVSGFHGNTDSVMVMFVLLSCLMAALPLPLFCGLFLGLSCQVKIVPVLLLPAFLLFWHHQRRLRPFIAAFIFTSVLLIFEPLLFSPGAYVKNVLSYGGYWGLWGFTYLIRSIQFQQLNRISFFGLSPAAIIISNFLKFIVVCSVLFLAWRRRDSDARGLVVTLAMSWLIFFIFAPGVAPQYFVWLTPFLLFVSPVFFAFFTGAASIFLFIFYSTISHSIHWYFGVSTNALSAVWAPWSLLPWITLILGSALIWRSTRQPGAPLKILTVVPAAEPYS